MKNNAFVSFITAGDPSVEITRDLIDALSEHSDIIELGLPFSDPIAEGEVIEAANMRALSAGMTTDKLFDMLETVDFEKIVILTYLNPVFVYGVEKFFDKCKKCGVYGVIIPDLPYEERGDILPCARKNDIHLITLIAPTSADRIKMLAKDATGFIYLVSSMGVTGVRSELTLDLTGIIEEIRQVTDVPVYIGFGISTPEQADKMRGIADGVIVGSAFVRLIEKHGEDCVPIVSKFLKEMTNNT